jgi:hypothetical protein
MVNGFFREYMVSQPMQDNLVCVLDGRPSPRSQHRERHLSVQDFDFSLLRSLTMFVTWVTPCPLQDAAASGA